MRPGPQEPGDEPVRSVLVYRALGLGDLLTGVPALRQLRRALPQARISLATPGALRPLVELIGAVDELLPTEELAPVDWTGPAPDLAIDLHGNGPASRTLLTGHRVLAFNTPDGPRWDPDEHERARWCRLVAHGLGVPGDPDDVLLDLPAEPSPATGAVVIHPGAASPSRRWPPERFAAVARELARSQRVVITGSASERSLVARVLRLAGPGVETLETGLAQLAALVAGASLVVCGDTGVGHLASAYATPSVLLFGPTPPTTWGPPPGPHRVLWHGPHRGDPHGDQPDPALLEIQVEEVLRSVPQPSA